MSVTEEVFLQLVRQGIGTNTTISISETFDWNGLEAIANEHGLLAIVLDGIEKLSDPQRPPKELLLQWIGGVMQSESQFAFQQKAAMDMALLFHNNNIRTYVLKGLVVAECYPKVNHRSSVDMDCFLIPSQSEFDAWSLGNDLIKTKGFEVKTDFYKNSTFLLPGLTVENHQYLTPFRGNKRLRQFEKVLQVLLHRDKGENMFQGTYLYRPPVMVSALFLIEHAYSHFLHQGSTWRYILDWSLFKQKHQNDINWVEFDVFIDEFGFRKFYNAFDRLGHFLLGELNEGELSNNEKRMLSDVWAPLDLHDTVQGLKGKLAIAGNTWRARGKYRHFAEISWIHALWIQVKGFFFINNPSLY